MYCNQEILNVPIYNLSCFRSRCQFAILGSIYGTSSISKLQTYHMLHEMIYWRWTIMLYLNHIQFYFAIIYNWCYFPQLAIRSNTSLSRGYGQSASFALLSATMSTTWRMFSSGRIPQSLTTWKKSANSSTEANPIADNRYSCWHRHSQVWRSHRRERRFRTV